MQYKMSAYIDSYDDITLLVDKKVKYKGKSFFLYQEQTLIEELKINFHCIERNFIKYGLKYQNPLCLHKEYMIMDDLHHMIPLYTGSIIRTAEFEAQYFYDGPLGVEYHPAETVFRLWSPVARAIRLELRKNGKSTYYEMMYREKGLWELRLIGDLEGYAYVYYVKIFSKPSRVLDPYGISSSANGLYNYIVNPEKFYQMKYEKPYFSGYYTDAVIYEANIRDMTSSLTTSEKGTFSGILNPDRSTDILKYLRNLGITHLQWMPIFDFGGVDDLHKDRAYNWGYNPEQYFVPSGWYSSDPDDPYERINELLKLIDEIHHAGLRVNMDVVYNHVFQQKTFPFDLLVPGYFYRVDFYGNPTNVSGCGNDLATEKRMCSRFIVDNLKYWAKTFSVSGFRFDLMGLLDIETLKQAYRELLQIEPNLMVYGEGWNMPNTIPDAYRPHAFNYYKIPTYAFFNDKYRDFLKGNQWNALAGYAFGNTDSLADIRELLAGSCLHQYKFNNPNQTINYVECHDNYTFFDYGSYRLKFSEEQVLKAARLALQMICISQGVPFIHAGEEFYRTKQGVENSYNYPDDINRWDEDRKQKYFEEIKGIEDLLAIRREYPEFRLRNCFDIEKKMHFIDNFSKNGKLCFVLEGNKYLLTVFVKNTDVEETIFLPNHDMIFDGHHGCLEQKKTYCLKDVGVYIFKEMR